MAMITLNLRTWKRNPCKIEPIRRVLAEAQTEYANKVVELYELTVANWDSPPRPSAIVRETFEADGRRVVEIGMRGSGVKIWTWLDQGFTRKVAILPGYEPKTVPGRLGGIVGAGRRAGKSQVGHLLKTPVPVEARRWTGQIAAIVRNGDPRMMSYSEYMRDRFRARIVNSLVRKVVR